MIDTKQNCIKIWNYGQVNMILSTEFSFKVLLIYNIETHQNSANEKLNPLN
jgi:hypothetical protein